MTVRRMEAAHLLREVRKIPVKTKARRPGEITIPTSSVRIIDFVRRYDIPEKILTKPEVLQQINSLARQDAKLKQIGFVGFRTPAAVYKKAAKTLINWKVARITTGKYPSAVEKQKLEKMLKTAVKKMK